MIKWGNYLTSDVVKSGRRFSIPTLLATITLLAHSFLIVFYEDDKGICGQ